MLMLKGAWPAPDNRSERGTVGSLPGPGGGWQENVSPELRGDSPQIPQLGPARLRLAQAGCRQGSLLAQCHRLRIINPAAARKTYSTPSYSKVFSLGK